ncbi:MAG: serine/threonine protein kinase, partial [Alphaproteobacteria bacterium]|nr:serine/threonine protein kinase [Alphaproteobacteria bacterium]
MSTQTDPPPDSPATRAARSEEADLDSATPPTLSTGTRQYRLMEQIGVGGFGSVVRAELVGASGFRKYVAVKLLNVEDHRERELGRRLRDEARILALLRHRTIVRVEDLVRIEGRWAVVMEYIEGQDLRQVLNLGPLPPKVAAEVCREVAMALTAAHRATHPDTGEPLSIVHRDIKPGNIRITPDGDVKVLDFGVARATFDTREATTRAVRFGSPGYMAPERFDGEDLPASDVFSLGVVLYESLAGRRLGQPPVRPQPFDAHVEQALTVLQEVRPELPGELVALLRDMLRYDAPERPDAHHVARGLRDMIAALPGPWLGDWAMNVVETTIPPAEAPGPRPARGEGTLDTFDGVRGDQRFGASTWSEALPRPAQPTADELLRPDDAPPPPPVGGEALTEAMGPSFEELDTEEVEVPAPPPAPVPAAVPTAQPAAARRAWAPLVALLLVLGAGLGWMATRSPPPEPLAVERAPEPVAAPVT